MEYHQPDTTWTIWAVTYEEFVEKFVMKGRFNPCVPQKIIENYRVAENIMAHSWYHYPMYDEAMTTIVGIIEWAVKHRCLDLDIPLKLPDEKDVLKICSLQELISELNKKEPGKHMNFHLDWARRLRNSVVHPNDFEFAGGTIFRAVREGVNIINKLFLPESLLLSFLEEKKKMDAQTKLFSKGGWSLQYNGENFLVEKCKVSFAIKADGCWHYLLSAYPLYCNFSEALQNHAYQPMHLLDLVDLKVKKNTLIAKHVDGEPVFLKPLTQEMHKIIYNRHTAKWRATERTECMNYKLSCEQDIESEESRLWYLYLLQADQE